MKARFGGRGIALLLSAVAIVLSGYANVSRSREANQSLYAAVVAQLNDRIGMRGRPSLILVVQSADCQGNLAVVSQLNELFSRSEASVNALAVRGLLLNHVDRIRHREVLLSAGIKFPTVFAEDRASAVVRKLRAAGYKETPVLIGFDGSGQVRVILPAMHLSPRSVASAVAIL